MWFSHAFPFIFLIWFAIRFQGPGSGALGPQNLWRRALVPLFLSHVKNWMRLYVISHKNVSCLIKERNLFLKKRKKRKSKDAYLIESLYKPTHIWFYSIMHTPRENSIYPGIYVICFGVYVRKNIWKIGSVAADGAWQHFGELLRLWSAQKRHLWSTAVVLEQAPAVHSENHCGFCKRLNNVGPR